MSDSVLLFHIDNYEQVDELHFAVRSILTMNPAITKLLEDSTPNTHVVVKPNWVQPNNINPKGSWQELITHPAVIETVVDELASLMGGIGHITICDAPHTSADFNDLLHLGNFTKRINQLRNKYPQITLQVIDLRREVWIEKEEVTILRKQQEGDPQGYVAVNLSCDSLFFGHFGEGHYYGADYDAGVVNSHHRGETQEYLISKTPIQCDLFVNVPKLKTHKKTGLTCSLKNLVGINGDKNWLPHHTEGTPDSKGDEYPQRLTTNRIEFHAKKILRRMALLIPGLGPWLMRKSRKVGKKLFGDNDKTVRSGNWYGNDTTWRMVLDLNRALLFADPNGFLRETNEKKLYVTIVDGIIGGEGEGPIAPSSVNSKILFGGNCPAIVDTVAAKLMGFTLEDLQLIMHAFEKHHWTIAETPMEQITMFDTKNNQSYQLNDIPPCVEGGFRPHFGWKRINRQLPK